MSLFFFHGQEDFLMQKDIEKLKNKLLDKSFISMNYKTYLNPDYLELIDILSAQPMMFGSSLNIVHCENYFNTKSKAEDAEIAYDTEDGIGDSEVVQEQTGFDDKQFKKFEEALSSVNEQVNVIFVCQFPRNSNKKVDTRKKMYKLLAKYAEVREFKQLPVYDKTLPSLIVKLGKDNDLQLTPNVCAKLIELLGSDLRFIDNELKKLQMYIYPNKQPSIDDVMDICSVTQDIFKLLDYFICAKKDEALKEFSLLSQTTHPLQIFALLQNTISRFINLKLLSRNHSSFEMSTILKMHEYRVKLELDKIKNYLYDELLSLKQRLIECEYKFKTGQIHSDEFVIEQLILSTEAKDVR